MNKKPKEMDIIYLDVEMSEKMVEVFKTNVHDPGQANMLLDQIHQSFSDYKANFDLEDCDKILRVKSAQGNIPPSPVINLLKEFGFTAEVLPED